MFREAFAVVAALVVVKPASISSVMARVDIATIIKGHPECIAPTFGKDLITTRDRMVTPDRLAEALEWLFIGAIGFDHTAHGAALGRVKPTIGSHAEAVHDRVGVLETEPGQVNFGWPVGLKVFVLIRVVEKVGWIEDPGTFGDRGYGSGDIEIVDKDAMSFEGPIPIGILMDRNSILAWQSAAARGLRYGVVDDPPMLVPTELFEPFRIRILSIFRHPQSAMGVECGHQRLGDGGFAEDHFPAQAFLGAKGFFSRCWIERRFGGRVFRWLG